MSGLVFFILATASFEYFSYLSLSCAFQNAVDFVTSEVNPKSSFFLTTSSPLAPYFFVASALSLYSFLMNSLSSPRYWILLLSTIILPHENGSDKRMVFTLLKSTAFCRMFCCVNAESQNKHLTDVLTSTGFPSSLLMNKLRITPSRSKM